jgi:hypothetical protein
MRIVPLVITLAIAAGSPAAAAAASPTPEVPCWGPSQAWIVTELRNVGCRTALQAVDRAGRSRRWPECRGSAPVVVRGWRVTAAPTSRGRTPGAVFTKGDRRFRWSGQGSCT